MEWVMAFLGLASLVGSFIFGGKQIEKEEETEQYNKDLNEKIMEREDNAWQRAVVDRSKSGLSVAGLSQGAGSGGSVSQLQAPQGNAVMANLMQNLTGQSFGLASSIYENKKNRQLQQDNFTKELELKNEQLKTDQLNAEYQRMKILTEIQSINDENIRAQGIYNHNMEIAKGTPKNPLYRVYGSQPSEVESLVRGLYNAFFDDNGTLINGDTSSPLVTDGGIEDSAYGALGIQSNNYIKSNIPKTYEKYVTSDTVPFTYNKDNSSLVLFNEKTRTYKEVYLETKAQVNYWENYFKSSNAKTDQSGGHRFK